MNGEGKKEEEDIEKKRRVLKRGGGGGRRGYRKRGCKKWRRRKGWKRSLENE